MPDEKPVEVQPEAPNTTPQQATTNGLSVAALVVGIVAFVSGWIPLWGVLVGIAALVLGILALKKTNGKGMAIAGIVTGGLGALTGILVTIFFVISLTYIQAGANEYRNQSIEKDTQNQQLLDAKKDFSKGETATFGTLEVKANSVTRDYIPESNTYKAGEGKEYVLVNVTVKNTGDESEYVGPYDFSIDSDGLSSTSAYISVDPELESDNLEPGDSVTGNIVYKAKKGATTLKLKYDTTVYSQGSGTKKLVYTLDL